MNYANPTSLRVGAKGMLIVRRFTVLGRVVLGMELDGETYYWQEFNLADDAGENATLVFEEGDAGPEWKLFTLFDPIHPMTAAKANAKRKGELVNLDGTPVRITLVDQSTVYHIEGVAPEGVEVGDVANYFNADAGEWMLVASWTGDEIEFYRGVDLRAASVAVAFGLPRPSLDGRAISGFSAMPGSADGNDSAGLIVKLLAVVLLAVAGYFIHSAWAAKRRNAPPVTQAAPDSPLTNGMHGTLALREFTITGRAVVEISAVGSKFRRLEYDLRTPGGDHALLVCGLNGGRDEWHLLQPAQTPPALTPSQAATQRLGDTVTADGVSMRVAGVFESRLITAESVSGVGGLPGATQYGFVAFSTNEWLLTRWNALGIQFHCGRVVSGKAVLAAFDVKAESTR